MELETYQDGQCLVLLTTGRVDGTNAAEFQGAVTEATHERDLPVVLDLENLSYISSAGLRVILLIARELRQKDQGFAACSLVTSVREVFEISGFDRIIPVHDSRDAAIDSLSA